MEIISCFLKNIFAKLISARFLPKNSLNQLSDQRWWKTDGIDEHHFQDDVIYKRHTTALAVTNLSPGEHMTFLKYFPALHVQHQVPTARSDRHPHQHSTDDTCPISISTGGGASDCVTQEACVFLQ
ncbi:hypothetical protein CEXT_25131 [Caerostris extrusa]|uniref:Uncharacterized protein n=1 Tax=Caerostris extrusa TaxID=172846 RepID=A0AAV4R1W5_CAEEX|nr:hypothetical protein CEXT_25131 [Caerostris extrusa]